MTSTPFFKVAGAGNDFILIDQRRKPFSGDLSKFAKIWCDRRRGIGADGVLVVLPSSKADARMRIFNADGSEADMCGNGLRCLVWYLSKNGRSKQITVDTRAGVMRAEVPGEERVRITMSRPKDLHLGMKLRSAGKSYQVHFVNTGVPHAVLLSTNPGKVDLAKLGPEIRHHRAFKPAGANVNIVKIESPHKVSIRTYERGVEAETLACGTGSVAAAVIGAALGRLQPPVKLKTTGGDILSVGFRQGKQPWQELYLEGPARILFQGFLSK